MTVGVTTLVDEGLGNSAYLVDLGDGRGLAVDVSVDLRTLRHEAERRRLRIAFAADTHLHADFLSGSRQLGAEDGAVIVASRAGHREFSHHAVDDGDEVDLGGLRLRTLETPGHTHEHIAYQLLDGDRVVGVFTGGSLIVGAAARTDLVSPERTEELARAQFRSIRRLAELPDDVLVWPTHGAGSFCSAPPGADRTSTIGNERATNALLRSPDEDTFVVRLLASLGSYPPYFRRLPELNRRGPALTLGEAVPALTVAEVKSLRSAGAEVVDVRPFAEFAAGHIEGALSNVLRPAFASWLGWLVPEDKPIVIVRNRDQDPAEVLWQARKIGYDQVAGDLLAVPADWTAGGLRTATIKLRDVAQLDETEVLDIRQGGEFSAGHVPGARHLELGALEAALDAGETLANGPTTLMCGHGERAMSAASLLSRLGYRNLSVFTGGPDDWSAATGRGLEFSP